MGLALAVGGEIYQWSKERKEEPLGWHTSAITTELQEVARLISVN